MPIHLDTASNLGEDCEDPNDVVLLINGKFECSWGKHFIYNNQMIKEQTMLKKYVLCVLERAYEKGLEDGKKGLQEDIKSLLNIEDKNA